MRKGFLMVLAVALVAVLAAPAVAGTDINGFIRSKAYVTNFDTPVQPAASSGGGTTPGFLPNDANSSGYVETRFRVRFSFGEENVKAIWFSEIDLGTWGDAAGYSGSNSGLPSSVQITNPNATGAQRNTGGALGGDRINFETKNIYVWFKIPNTSLDFTVGLQNQTDNFQGLLYGAADMAGIFATGKYEPISWKLGWAKLYENNTNAWDDQTLYMGLLNWAPSKDLKLGFSLYFLQNDTAKTLSTTQLPYTTAFPAYLDNTPATFTVWTPGIDFAWNAGPVALSGFVLYNFGEFTATSGGATRDISGLALDVRVDANLGPGKLFAEGLFVSGGDNNPGSDYKSIITLSDANASPGGNSAFTRMNYQILMGNADDINQNTCLIGCAGSVSSQSPSNGGRGMWTAGAGYSMKAGDKTSLYFGGGYLQSKTLTSADNARGATKNMGSELNANVNYNIMKGLDFGLYAAYAWIGDFFKGTTVGVNDSPDDAYTMFARLNYAF